MTITNAMLVGGAKHVVAVDPRERERNNRPNITVLEIAADRRGHDVGHRATQADIQRLDLEQSWFVCAMHFFMGCFIYGLGAYSIVRYVFTLLHMADGLVNVDVILKERYGQPNTVDWSFFTTFGLVTVSIEMYTLVLTFLMMVRYYEAIGKLTDNEAWDKFQSAISFVMSFVSLCLILLFLYYATAYHYMMIHKVLSLSPNAEAALAIFHNSTATLINPTVL